MKSAAWLFWLYNTFSVFLPRSVPPVPHDASDGADAPNRIEPASQAHPATVDTLSFERIPLVPSRRAGIPQFAVTVPRCSSVVGAMGFPISPSPTHGAHHGVQ